MNIIKGIREMQSCSEAVRNNGLKIGFVPTMGALHVGHLELIKHAKSVSGYTVASIFVNPKQFGPSEDFDNYPRQFENDADMLAKEGIDILFAPEPNEMYGDGYQTFVEVRNIQKHLCGQFRPGHFEGVATVVLKLLNIVKPHYAIFGEKDYQQLRLITKMVEDLNLDVKIQGYPIVREHDGLALSSRNRYLNSESRQKALSISEALFQIKQEFDSGTSDADTLCDMAREILGESSVDDIDYISIIDDKIIEPKKIASSGDRVAIAVRVGGARLIDNIKL